MKAGSLSPARVAVLALLALPLTSASPEDFRARVGVYIWGSLASDLPAAVADAKGLGATQAVRLYIGPGSWWDPSDPADNRPLDLKVLRPDYQEALRAFPVVAVTAYDSVSGGRYRRSREPPGYLAQVTAEFRRFALELAKTPGRKLVSNWELENDCPDPASWPGCQAYYQARLDGILQGRQQAKALRYPGEILTMFEFTRIPGYAGQPSGLVEVGAKLKGVDVLSYSAWASIGYNYGPSLMRESFRWALDAIRKFARERRLSGRVVIGEFGEYWNFHPDAARLKAIAETCLDAGVEYLFIWVLYEQPGQIDDHGRDASHFGKYFLNRQLTPQGEKFRGWFNPPESSLERRPPAKLTIPAPRVRQDGGLPPPG